eukprot:TRINITY_DN9407_c0_g1_i3.p1 TRINITY_DN9407_c0_g1~~TRINITY_DN9407_c0_g1_i3.p1  ORF type:complete len:165 (-),score=21.74 TRINITY_DN9407_c0_g1_i3:290-784(-)
MKLFEIPVLEQRHLMFLSFDNMQPSKSHSIYKLGSKMHVSATRSSISLFPFEYLEIIPPLKAIRLGFSLAEICRLDFSSPRPSIGFLCEELWLISPLRALPDLFARKSRRSSGVHRSLPLLPFQPRHLRILSMGFFGDLQVLFFKGFTKSGMPFMAWSRTGGDK